MKKYITLREKPELKEAAAAWFHSILYLQDNPETGPNLIPGKESESNSVR